MVTLKTQHASQLKGARLSRSPVSYSNGMTVARVGMMQICERPRIQVVGGEREAVIKTTSLAVISPLICGLFFLIIVYFFAVNCRVYIFPDVFTLFSAIMMMYSIQLWQSI